MEVACSNRVIARNSMGRFIKACEDAATETVKQLIRDGAELSSKLAPVGPDVDPRTVKLASSLEAAMLSSTSGHWYSTARHALPVENSGAAHLQTGHVSFFWANQGRDWAPGSNLINHPGNPAQPFLRPAYEVIMGKAMRVAASKYP